MDSAVLDQLVELAKAFRVIGLRPVIGGGLGLYLLFHDRADAVRATNDIDLMIPPSQAVEETRRRALAEVITSQLQYVVREDGKHFRFGKEPDRRLDVLAPPIEGVPVEGGSVKLVRSILHGRLTPEACFIEEDLRTVDLAGLSPSLIERAVLTVDVPSPTNMLLLKLFAFDDRDTDARRDTARAQAHAYDIYVVTALARRSDYVEGRRFVERHDAADIVQKARGIISAKFSTAEQSGWQHVLASTAFAPDRPLAERREALDGARRRLLRWLEGPGLRPSE